MVQLYLAHPFETIGTIEENIKEEQEIAKKLNEDFPFILLIRPLRLIPMTMERQDALNRCIELLKDCDGIIMSGEWYTDRNSFCWNELSFMVDDKKPVYEFKDNKLERLF